MACLFSNRREREKGYGFVWVGGGEDHGGTADEAGNDQHLLSEKSIFNEN